MHLSAPTSKTSLGVKLAAPDVAWAVVAPFASLALRAPVMVDINGARGLPHDTYVYAAMTVLCALPAFALLRIRDIAVGFVSARDVRLIGLACGAAAAGSAALTFALNRLVTIPRSTPLIYFVVLAAGLLSWRALAAPRAKPTRNTIEPEAPSDVRRVILVGVDRFSSTVIQLTDCQSPRTTQIAAALDPHRSLLGRTVNGVNIVGTPEDLPSVIEEYRVHGVDVEEVWASDALFAEPGHVTTALGQACEALGVKLSSLSSALNLRPAPSSRGARTAAASSAALSDYFHVKRVIDLIVAAVLICVLAPLALLVAAVVAADVGVPVIFWQERIGRGGKKFLLYKFRTYQAPFDRGGRPLAGDARLSKLGRFVRKTELDEIPQLLNVLLGDMSLIGPRPLLPVDQPSDPQVRLQVRPGLSGWAQVIGGTRVTAEEKDALDAWYIRHASLALDLEIALRTIAYLVRVKAKNLPAIEAAMLGRRKAEESDARPSAERSRTERGGHARPASAAALD